MHVVGTDYLEDVFFEHVARLPLTSLILGYGGCNVVRCARVTTRGFAHLGQLSTLTQLTLCRPGFDLAPHIASLAGLEELTIDTFDAQKLASLVALKRVVFLHIAASPAACELTAFPLLGTFEWSTGMSLRLAEARERCADEKDDGWDRVAFASFAGTAISRLALDNAKYRSVADGVARLSSLAPCPHLAKLSCYVVSDEELRAIAKIPSLEDVEITLYTNNIITGAGWRALEDLRRLRRLEVYADSVSKRAIADGIALANLPSASVHYIRRSV